jgi:TonB family protein
MESLFSVVCSLLLVVQAQSAPVPATQQNTTPAPAPTSLVGACKQPCLEDGTPVYLRISQTVSSADAHLKDRVWFEVLEDIRISDVLVIGKGAGASGTVTEAQPKRRMGRGGKLEIVMDSVQLVDGESAALRATKEVEGGGGKDISIPKGTEVPTFVNGNFQLDLPKFQQFELYPDANQDGYSKPSCVFCPKAIYSPEALQAYVQGVVVLQVIVEKDGSIKQVSVVKDLQYGLTAKAIEAVKRWKLKPATGPDGNPVAVRQTVELVFRMDPSD